jgi:hypothetical protein
MAIMLAAGLEGALEFFAQPLQKIISKQLPNAASATPHTGTKKPALISQVRAVKSKGNLE